MRGRTRRTLIDDRDHRTWFASPFIQFLSLPVSRWHASYASLTFWRMGFWICNNIRARPRQWQWYQSICSHLNAWIFAKIVTNDILNGFIAGQWSHFPQNTNEYRECLSRLRWGKMRLFFPLSRAVSDMPSLKFTNKEPKHFRAFDGTGFRVFGFSGLCVGFADSRWGGAYARFTSFKLILQDSPWRCATFHNHPVDRSNCPLNRFLPSWKNAGIDVRREKKNNRIDELHTVGPG